MSFIPVKHLLHTAFYKLTTLNVCVLLSPLSLTAVSKILLVFCLLLWTVMHVTRSTVFQMNTHAHNCTYILKCWGVMRCWPAVRRKVTDSSTGKIEKCWHCYVLWPNGIIVSYTSSRTGVCNLFIVKLVFLSGDSGLPGCDAVTGLVVRDVSKERSANISENEGTAFFRNVGKH